MSGRLIFPDTQQLRSPTAVQARNFIPFAIPFEAMIGRPIVHLMQMEIAIDGISGFGEPEDSTDTITIRAVDREGANDANYSVVWLSKVYPGIIDLRPNMLLLGFGDRLEIVSSKCRVFGVLHGMARRPGWNPGSLRSP